MFAPDEIALIVAGPPHTFARVLSHGEPLTPRAQAWRGVGVTSGSPTPSSPGGGRPEPAPALPGGWEQQPPPCPSAPCSPAAPQPLPPAHERAVPLAKPIRRTMTRQQLQPNRAPGAVQPAVMNEHASHSPAEGQEVGSGVPMELGVLLAPLLVTLLGSPGTW